MPWERLESIDDPRLEIYRNLKDTNRTRWQGCFIAEGEKLAERLLASDFEVASLLVGLRHEARWRALVLPEVTVYLLDDAKIEALIGYKFHRGVLACGLRKSGESWQAALPPQEEPCTIVVCPDTSDPENLGSIIRLSAAFGVSALLLGEGCCDAYSRRVLRVSMGTVFRLPIYRVANLASDVRQLRGLHGVKTVATTLNPNAAPLNQFACPPRVALMLGSEAHGLSHEMIAECDAEVTIPMQPGVDSLNVSVAAGIFLHHVAASSDYRYSPRQ